MTNINMDRFNKSKEQLINLFGETQKISKSYEKTIDDKPDSDSANNAESKSKRLDNSMKRLERDSFKVLVVGEFKRGKSTFINALLGEKVLPAYSRPCTAAINEVSYGEKKAEIHFVKPLTEDKKILNNLPEDVQEFIRKNRKSNNECDPMPIENFNEDFNSLEKYVTIPEDEKKEQGQSVLESPLEMVKLSWPLERLKDSNVIIIDSPGLNENATRTDVTEKYYSKVDAVIFVISCISPISASEQKTLKQLNDDGLNDIFFICNMYDRLLENVENDYEDDPDEQKNEINRLKKRFQDGLLVSTRLRNTEFKDKCIHLVSAQKALKARQKYKDDPAKQKEILEKWGFSQMEEALYTFLANYRGNIKLHGPGNALKLFIEQMTREILPARLKMFDQDYETLKANYEKSLPDIQQEENRRNLILDKVKKLQKEFANDIESSFRDFMSSQIGMIPSWIRNHQFKNSLTMMTWESSSKQIDRIGKECIDVVEENMEEQLQKWRNGELKYMFNDFIDNVKRETEKDIKSFYAGLDNIKQNLNITVENHTEEIGTLERVIAATGGFFVGGIGSAMVGGSLGLNDMFKSLLPQIGLAAGMILAGITNPLILLPALFATGSMQTWLSMNSKADQIKAKIADELQSQLHSDLPSQAKKITKKVQEKTNELIQTINNGLSDEIKSLKDNVESSLREMESKKSKIEADKDKIKQDIHQLESIHEKLLGFDFMKTDFDFTKM